MPLLLVRGQGDTYSNPPLTHEITGVQIFFRIHNFSLIYAQVEPVIKRCGIAQDCASLEVKGQMVLSGSILEIVFRNTPKIRLIVGNSNKNENLVTLND
jgi:hypothetical protein